MPWRLLFVRAFSFVPFKENTMYSRIRMTAIPLIALFLFALAPILHAQSVSASYKYNVDLTGATAPPDLGGFPSIRFPQEAIKKGVEGKMIVEINLAADGQVKDFKFIETLPYGYEQAVLDAFKTFNFAPARSGDEAIDVTLRLEYTVTMVYDSRNKSIKKPKITLMPDAVYPESERADERKGAVSVSIMFKKDGSHQVLSVGSTMPRAFDNAAAEAAKKIEFTPAVHKKTKMPVTASMTVVFKFKP